MIGRPMPARVRAAYRAEMNAARATPDDAETRCLDRGSAALGSAVVEGAQPPATGTSGRSRR